MPSTVRLPRGAWIALALLVGACASGPPAPDFGEDGPGGPDGGRGGGPGGPGGGGRLNFFVSPAGQPFRARPDQPYPSSAWFAQADRDHDGRITRDEFRADAEAFFHSLDTDHDGMVDGFEIAAYEQAMPEMTPQVGSLRPGEGMNMQLGRRGGGEGGGGGGGGQSRRRGARPGDVRQGVALYSWFNDPEPVAAADSDFNSRISLDEARAVADRRFAMLDPMGRGYLVLAELPKTAAQARLESAKEQRRRNQPGSAVGDQPRRQRPQP